MRQIAATFVVASPTGARIRTRLRPNSEDERVLWAVGQWLGRLAGQDLAMRCRLGGGDDRRAERKRTLTPLASSRWAGTITRTSNEQRELGWRNLLNARAGLRRACRTIRERLAVPVGGRQGRVRGYASQTERFAKQCRLQHLESRLAKVQDRIASGQVSVCRGSRRLAKLRHAPDRDEVPLTRTEWRARWEAARVVLTANGEAAKAWGNETIRVHPDQGWLELRLPTPLAHLSNTPGRAATYRLSCPVTFTHRADEWAAQAASGAVRYDIFLDPAKGRGRWYLDASWRLPAPAPPTLDALREHPSLGIDLNADHLAGWVVDPAGNPVGEPVTIALDLDGQPASTRDGRLRAAVAELCRMATMHGCRSITVEDLDFTDARQIGRETLGRGRRGRRLRRVVTGMPTRRFRDLLVGMAANTGLWVIAVDPGWTSTWGGRYWQQPLNQATRQPVTVSRHHAAALVIGRRGLGHRARRRGGCAPSPPEDGQRRATDSAGRPTATSVAAATQRAVSESTAQGPDGPGGQRAGPAAPQDPPARAEHHREPGGTRPFGAARPHCYRQTLT